MKLFDSHCHLQDEKLLPQIDSVMERAGQAGVQGFCVCGTSESDWPVVSALGSRFKQITPAFGIHPWYVALRPLAVNQVALTEQRPPSLVCANELEGCAPSQPQLIEARRSCPQEGHLTISTAKRTPDWQNVLRDYLQRDPGCGVGEIGLDRAIKERNDAEQIEVFLAQIRLAGELGRPVSIHCRRAWDVMPTLLAEAGGLPKGFVLHSYSGSSELVEALVKLGAYFSFSGTITYHRNKRGHKAMMAVPVDRLLIETDSPDLMPVLPAGQPNDAVPNEPANLVHVLRKIAELKGMPEEELAEHIWSNAEKIFGETAKSTR